jgi:hypothetical protein
MADAMLLASQRARALALERTGFGFTHTSLEPAVRAALGLA